MTNTEAKLDLIMSMANLGSGGFEHRTCLMEQVLKNTPAFVNITLVEHVYTDRYAPCKDVINRLGTPKNIHLVQIRGKDHYNHQYAFNVGAMAAKTDILVFSDTDILPSNGFYDRLHDYIQKTDLPWAIAWKDLNYQDESGHITHTNHPSPMNAEGGMNYFKRSFFQDIGGWNDWMGDITGGDNEIARRAEYYSGAYHILDETLTHLWHPKSPVKQKRSKFYIQNQDILNFSWGHPDLQIQALKKHPPTQTQSRPNIISWPQVKADITTHEKSEIGRLYPKHTHNLKNSTVSVSNKPPNLGSRTVYIIAQNKSLFKIGYQLRKFLPKRLRQAIKNSLQQNTPLSERQKEKQI